MPKTSKPKTKARTPHPDFEAAHPSQRWTGSLTNLWRILELKTTRTPNAWHSAVLPGGAWVAMRRLLGAERQVRIARRTRSCPAWQREVDTFRKYFSIESWPLARSGRKNGFAFVVYREPVDSSA